MAEVDKNHVKMRLVADALSPPFLHSSISCINLNLANLFGKIWKTNLSPRGLVWTRSAASWLAASAHRQETPDETICPPSSSRPAESVPPASLFRFFADFFRFSADLFRSGYRRRNLERQAREEGRERERERGTITRQRPFRPMLFSY